jgi:hypothetical protein
LQKKLLQCSSIYQLSSREGLAAQPWAVVRRGHASCKLRITLRVRRRQLGQGVQPAAAGNTSAAATHAGVQRSQGTHFLRYSFDFMCVPSAAAFSKCRLRTQRRCSARELLVMQHAQTHPVTSQ